MYLRYRARQVESDGGLAKRTFGNSSQQSASSLDEIAANDHNLNIPRCVEADVNRKVRTVDDAMRRLQDGVRAAFAVEKRLIGVLK